MLSVGQDLGFDVNVIEWHLPLVGQLELDDTFHPSMDGLIFSNYDVAARLPFEPPLTRNYVVGVHLLVAQHLNAMFIKEYPNRLPAESLVF